MNTPYPGLTAALRAHGHQPVTEWGLSDHIVCLSLADGSQIVVSPPQEPAQPHPPTAWLAVLQNPETGRARVIYNSEPAGPDARNAGALPPLLARILAHLDGLGGPPGSDKGDRSDDAEGPTARATRTQH